MNDPVLWFFNLCLDTSTNPDGSLNLHSLATGLVRTDPRTTARLYAVVGIFSEDRTRSYELLLTMTNPEGNEWPLDTRKMGFTGEKVIGMTRFPLDFNDIGRGLHWINLYVENRKLGQIPCLISEDEFPEYLH